MCMRRTTCRDGCAAGLARGQRDGAPDRWRYFVALFRGEIDHCREDGAQDDPEELIPVEEGNTSQLGIRSRIEGHPEGCDERHEQQQIPESSGAVAFNRTVLHDRISFHEGGSAALRCALLARLHKSITFCQGQCGVNFRANPCRFPRLQHAQWSRTLKMLCLSPSSNISANSSAPN